jgi:hypothetical protein
MTAPAFRLSRRALLKSATAATAALALPQMGRAADAPEISVRALTRGPKAHWFAYYDKLQFDPTDRYALGMATAFEHRSPKPDDAIGLGMIDLHDNDRWIELGESRAWCWQQGCMLQWLPGSKSEVIYNDRDGDRFISHILDVTTGKRRTIPYPIYAVTPDGRSAVSCDFGRLATLRPGYGYAGVPDAHADELAPKQSGIFRVDLANGTRELIISVAEMAKVPYQAGDFGQARHWFNHLLVSPSGDRFIFLHRWQGEKSFVTRMVTARLDGSDIRIVDPWGKTSHFIWRDPQHILAWSWHPSQGDGFYLYKDADDGKVELVGKDVMTRNGHCTYLPGNEWILNDTYPQKDRCQEVYLYHVPSGRKVVLGRFLSPKEYAGEWRCDTHPRLSRNGRCVTIDSPHGGNRQIYAIDIAGVVG